MQEHRGTGAQDHGGTGAQEGYKKEEEEEEEEEESAGGFEIHSTVLGAISLDQRRPGMPSGIPPSRLSKSLLPRPTSYASTRGIHTRATGH